MPIVKCFLGFLNNAYCGIASFTVFRSELLEDGKISAMQVETSQDEPHSKTQTTLNPRSSIVVPANSLASNCNLSKLSMRLAMKKTGAATAKRCLAGWGLGITAGASAHWLCQSDA